jgi:Protein of unknown function (DUF3300)
MKESNMQTRLTRNVVNVTLAALFAIAPAIAQQPPATSPPAQAESAGGAKTFSQQDLDTLLAPVALYPDALLAQVLMASTYPLEIVEAARWAKANPGVKDQALQDAMEKQSWDASVKSLTAVPKVLDQMNEKLDWTQKLGDAFLAQKEEMMATVQQLRAKAAAAGNLKASPEVAVKTEQEAGKTVYIIESAKPEVVYVPTYNPYTIYGTWWYAAPPYYMYPPAYVYPPGLAFATGVVVGAAIWGNMNWRGNDVNINVNKYNNFNKTNIQNTNFQHNADHRKGVAYQNQNVANKYNRGTSAQTSQARSQYQGRADTASRGGGQSQPRASNYGGGGSQRASPSQSSAGSRGGGGGFSGAGSGASTRAASSRGGASRGGGGGGGRRR